MFVCKFTCHNEQWPPQRHQTRKNFIVLASFITVAGRTIKHGTWYFNHDLNFQVYKDVGRGEGNKSVLKRCQNACFGTVHFIHTCLPTFFIARCSGVMVSSSSTAYKQTEGFNTHRLRCCVTYLLNDLWQTFGNNKNQELSTIYIPEERIIYSDR